jgi:hypothetical protein
MYDVGADFQTGADQAEKALVAWRPCEATKRYLDQLPSYSYISILWW